MKNIFNLLKKDNIDNPPYDYYFLLDLDEKEYTKYLAKIFYLNTGEKLPLLKKLKVENGKLKVNYEIDKSKCKTFNQKLQWIKLYGVTDLMKKCTDKVAVHDYVKEKIGEEYLKPVLQIIQREMPQSKQYENNDVSTYFDQIDFASLPNAFVIKCNHGCKWQYIIKNKEEFLNNKQLFEHVKRQMTGWLEQEWFPWGGFEMQYKGIKPKILIEPLLRDMIDKQSIEINVYCFNGIPEIIVKIHNKIEYTFYDKNFNNINNIFFKPVVTVNERSEGYIKQAVQLSSKLSSHFDFVRVDFLLYKQRLYFLEMTFTPYSGFYKLRDYKTELKYG